MAIDWLAIGTVILCAAFNGVAWLRSWHHARVASDHSLAAFTSAVAAGGHAATAEAAADVVDETVRAYRCRARKGCG